jgi:hypothetical protein
MNPDQLRRNKLLLSAVFLAAATGFILPFLVISIDERLGNGNGIELATGNPDLSGRYVHASYEGQVEEGMNLAEYPSALAFFALLLGAVGAWLPRRNGFWLGLAAALAALLGLFWLRQAVSSPNLLAEVEIRYGYWLSGVGVLAAMVVAGLLLYRSSWTYLNR